MSATPLIRRYGRLVTQAAGASFCSERGHDSRAPGSMVLSGPTGGAMASGCVARDLGIDHLVTIDMGAPRPTSRP